MQQFSVAIVEDQAIVRELMAEFIAADPGMRVTIRAERGEEFFQLLDGKTVDLVILDIALPDASGIDIARRIKRMRRPPKVLMVTSADRPEPMREAMDAGADGIVSKGAPIAQLKAALKAVMSGGLFVDPTAMALLKQAETVGRSALTERERQIAIMVARGCSSKQIGEDLGISEKTVTNHRTALMKKIGAHNGADITRYAAGLGWV